DGRSLVAFRGAQFGDASWRTPPVRGGGAVRSPDVQVATAVRRDIELPQIFGERGVLVERTGVGQLGDQGRGPEGSGAERCFRLFSISRYVPLMGSNRSG